MLRERALERRVDAATNGNALAMFRLMLMNA
jgi:hypothetical protein